MTSSYEHTPATGNAQRVQSRLRTGLFIEGVLFVLFARVLVRALPMRLWRSQVACSGQSNIEHIHHDTVRQTVRAAERAAEMLPGSTRCLPLALAIRAMLARRDLRSCLRIGVDPSAGTHRFHAWLEANGKPLTAILDPGSHRPLVSRAA